MSKKGRNRRVRPYSIDSSIPEAFPTGSLNQNIGESPQLTWKIDDNISPMAPTSSKSFTIESTIDEQNIENTFKAKTGQTLYDILFYFFSGLRRKSFSFLLLLGFFVTHGIPYYNNFLLTWKDTLRATFSFFIWFIFLVFINLIENKLHKK